MILSWLQGQRQAMVEVLSQWVLCESPSQDHQALQKMLNVLQRAFESPTYQVQRLAGDHILIRPRKRSRPIQLLLGHCDTVWPLTTLTGMPLQVDSERLSGPGCYDMKGGLVQILFALRALQALGLTPPLAPYVLINSDEEIGSRSSARWIRALAQRARRAFVLEPSLGPAGKLKTTRKGVSSYTVAIEGRPAHAGLDPEAGASAILELSFLIQKLHALNDAARGISINVGLVQGGLRANVVAPESRAVVDVRVPTEDDRLRIDARIRALQAQVPGVRLSIQGVPGRPPLEATPGNQRLWLKAQRIAQEHLGICLEQGQAGGGSDGSTTSLYCPTLDGLGAVGGGAHATDEHILIDSLVERTALLTHLLMEKEEDADI